MNAVAEKTVFTPDDLIALPDEKDFELVDGHLVERYMGTMSSWVAGEILFLIRTFLKSQPIGLVYGADNGYQCFPDDPNKVRKPDVSFVKHGRLPADWPNEGYFRVRPDLAVEVLSLNDQALDTDTKVHEYQKAGVPLVWVVNPSARVVRVHRPDYTSVSLIEGDELSGEDVLPGFRCGVGDVFPAPPPAG